MLTVFLLLCSLNEGQSVAESRIDIWADNLIKYATNRMKTTDREFIPVPEMDEEYVAHIGKHPVNYGLHASKGVFGDLSSLKKVKNVSTSLTENNINIELLTALTKAGVHFDYCTMWYGSCQTTDELDVKVPVYKEAYVFLSVSVNLKQENCTPSIGLRVSGFDDIDIIFNDICVSEFSSLVNNWVKTFFKLKVISTIEHFLTAIFIQELNLHNICDVII